MKKMTNIEAVEQLLSSIRGNTKKDIMDRGVISLMITTWLFPHEICRLKLQDFKLINDNIFIKRRESLSMVLPIHQNFTAYIKDHIRNLSISKIRRDDWFYQSKKGRIRHGNIVYYNEPSHLRYMIAERCKIAGLPKLSPIEICDLGFIYALPKATTLPQILSILENSNISRIEIIMRKLELYNKDEIIKHLRTIEFKQ
jgi:integrase